MDEGDCGATARTGERASGSGLQVSAPPVTATAVRQRSQCVRWRANLPSPSPVAALPACDSACQPAAACAKGSISTRQSSHRRRRRIRTRGGGECMAMTNLTLTEPVSGRRCLRRPAKGNRRLDASRYSVVVGPREASGATHQGTGVVRESHRILCRVEFGQSQLPAAGRQACRNAVGPPFRRLCQRCDGIGRSTAQEAPLACVRARHHFPDDLSFLSMLYMVMMPTACLGGHRAVSG